MAPDGHLVLLRRGELPLSLDLGDHPRVLVQEMLELEELVSVVPPQRRLRRCKLKFET